MRLSGHTSQPPGMRLSGHTSQPPGMRSGGHTSQPPLSQSGLAQPGSVVPVTKPGVAPAAAIPRTPSPSRPPVNQPLMPVPPVQIAQKKKKTWLFVLIGVLLAGGTATLVALTLAGGEPNDGSTGSTPAPTPAPTNVPPAEPVKLVGTVKFDLQPADAEILLGGKVVHAGSPWTSELPAGIHQIEIKKQGFKSWLTSLELSSGESHSMRVMLEPITSTVVEDATLTITTTPAGLDVEIDGVLLPEKTPIKTNLKVGPHTLVVKQNGVEVWNESINAENSSEYEFNPSFTDDKKRERAQRAGSPARPPARPPAPAAPASAPAPASSTETGSAAPEAPKADAPTADTTPNPPPGGAQPPINTPL